MEPSLALAASSSDAVIGVRSYPLLEMVLAPDAAAMVLAGAAALLAWDPMVNAQTSTVPTTRTVTSADRPCIQG